jgi:hypothetical protein
MVDFVVIWFILKPFGIFYSHFVYFTAIWYILRPLGKIFGSFGLSYGPLVDFWSFGIHILRPFGIFLGHLVHLSRLGLLYQKKSGNPCAYIDLAANVLSSHSTLSSASKPFFLGFKNKSKKAKK